MTTTDDLRDRIMLLRDTWRTEAARRGNYEPERCGGGVNLPNAFSQWAGEAADELDVILAATGSHVPNAAETERLVELRRRVEESSRAYWASQGWSR